MNSERITILKKALTDITIYGSFMTYLIMQSNNMNVLKDTLILSVLCFILLMITHPLQILLRKFFNKITKKEYQQKSKFKEDFFAYLTGSPILSTMLYLFVMGQYKELFIFISVLLVGTFVLLVLLNLIILFYEDKKKNNLST